jgi:pimeloyl-ACP methyl ester carboxylesterase
VFLDLSVSSFDYLEQLSALMRDPIFYSGERLPRGNGEPVVLLPGYFAGDWSMAPMARWLRRIGYDSYLSGIDFNLGCPREKVERLEARVIGIARETGSRVTLIGHSLGGVLAIARRGVATSSPSRDRAGRADSTGLGRDEPPRRLDYAKHGRAVAGDVRRARELRYGQLPLWLCAHACDQRAPRAGVHFDSFA